MSVWHRALWCTSASMSRCRVVLDTTHDHRFLASEMTHERLFTYGLPRRNREDGDSGRQSHNGVGLVTYRGGPPNLETSLTHYALLHACVPGDVQTDSSDHRSAERIAFWNR